jgi:hypothetical protein
MGYEEEESIKGIAIAVPVYRNDLHDPSQEDSEELDPLYVKEQVKIGTDRGRLLRDIEIERDQLAQHLALEKQENDIKTEIAIGQANAYFRNQEGLTVYVDNAREETEHIKLMQQRTKTQNGTASRVTYSNCPGGGYNVTAYDIQEYEGMTYDTQFEYKSVYEE